MNAERTAFVVVLAAAGTLDFSVKPAAAAFTINRRIVVFDSAFFTLHTFSLLLTFISTNKL